MTQVHQPIDLGSLDQIEVPYVIGGENYVLRSGDGDVARKYSNALLASNRIQIGSDRQQVIQMENAADAESFLVSMCLFKDNGNGSLLPVQLKVIRSWPNRIIRQLFDKAKEITGLDVPDNLEDLRRQRDELNKKIAEMELNGESDPTNGRLVDSTAG